jgi:hypothetical protein
MATKPTIQEDAQTSAIMARLANNPELHQALNTSPEILASHAIPETMQGTNNPDEDVTKNCYNAMMFGHFCFCSACKEREEEIRNLMAKELSEQETK